MLARVEAALRDDERWDRLVELLLRRLDLQEDEDEQLAALREVARIFRERLAAPARALMPGIAMLRLRPTDDELWENLRADAGAANEWEQLVTQASEIAQAAGPTPEAARIWRELARVLRENLDRPDDALAAYREALVADPADRETRDAEADLLRQLERWQELATVLRAASSEADEPGARGRAHARSGRAVRDAAGRQGSAITAYESVLAIDPDAHGGIAARALERLYESEKRWADLARLLERRALQSAPAEAFALRRRRAEILADDLERSTRRPRSWSCCPPTTRRSPIAACSTCWSASTSAAERHDDYLRTLQRQADAIADAGRAARDPAPAGGRGRSAPRRGWIGRPRRWNRSCASSRATREAFAALERIYRGADRPAALAAAMARRLEVTDTIEAQARAAVRAGRNLRTRAGRVGAGARGLQGRRGGGRRAARDLRRDRSSGGAPRTLGRRRRSGAQVGRKRARGRGRARGARARAPPQRRAGGGAGAVPRRRRARDDRHGAGRAADARRR